MEEIANKEIKLSDFPPKLRKIIDYVVENKDFYNLDEAINQLGLNPHSISTMKSRLKKRGIVLEDYIYEKRNERIRKYVPYVDNSLVNRAIEGSAKHQELFYKRTGDLIDRHETNVNVGLQFVFGGGGGMPEDIREDYEKRQALKKLNNV
jgi:hypothetical protein